MISENQKTHIESLLKQKSYKNLLNKELEDYFAKKTILITGAAGSIGSELARLLSVVKCKLVLLDIAESALYNLQQDLESKKNRYFIVGDLRDSLKMDYVFKKHEPEIILHAAAYKHVPLMENFAYEAIKLNFFGTKILADLAIQYQTKTFINISTDKAVNPISVMGMTKRIAENYINQLPESNTRFLTVRFGNVIGSNGSILPLFKSQLKAKKPLSITHKEATRYFISVHKASQLILQTATLNAKQACFVFEMHAPIKIYNIAKILLLQNNLDSDNIRIIGLREGEKLHEELISETEQLTETKYTDIKLVINRKSPQIIDVDALSKITPTTSKENALTLLKKLTN